jgi:tripartite-type tricarboxylate transporter receptor subunit TctC
MNSPNLLAAAVIQRTKRIKLLIYGNLLPLHEPLRLAEELGVIAAARSEPDGYTLLFAVSGVLLTPLVNTATPYDLFRDLVPVSQVSRSTGVLLVNNTVPAHTLDEFIALARAAPDKFDMGNFGFGSSSHLQGAMLARRIGAESGRSSLSRAAHRCCVT